MSSDRRPIGSRHTKIASQITDWLAKMGCRPNQISILSVVFAVLSAICLFSSMYVGNTVRVILFITAALCIGLRLLCNLFDGMLAIEAGFATKLGEIYNDLPDRISDIVIMLGAGVAASAMQYGMMLGWLAALLALMTAYTRYLGFAAGTKQYFIGPMAKQERMACIIGACLLSALCGGDYFTEIFSIALILIVIGASFTVFRRVNLIAKELA